MCTRVCLTYTQCNIHEHKYTTTKIQIQYTYDRLRSVSGLKSASTDIIILNHGLI
jgi:hypothetical protein